MQNINITPWYIFSFSAGLSPPLAEMNFWDELFGVEMSANLLTAIWKLAKLATLMDVVAEKMNRLEKLVELKMQISSSMFLL